MIEPTGYTALDLIGFTDKGNFDPNATYVKNDLVHDDNGSIWRVLIDDTSGVTPAEGLSYTIFIRNQADAAKQIIAPVETNPATGSHVAGTQLIFNDVLYDVTTAISATDALVVYPDTGYNIKPAPLVTSQIQALTKNMTNALAPIENGPKFSKPYYKGAQFIYQNNLYQLTVTSVSTADNITPGGNCDGVASVASQVAMLGNKVKYSLISTSFNGTTDTVGRLFDHSYSLAGKYIISAVSSENSEIVQPVRLSDSTVCLQFQNSADHSYVASSTRTAYCLIVDLN